jgi:hypothetical protein
VKSFKFQGKQHCVANDCHGDDFDFHHRTGETCRAKDVFGFARCAWILSRKELLLETIVHLLEEIPILKIGSGGEQLINV